MALRIITLPTRITRDIEAPHLLLS